MNLLKLKLVAAIAVGLILTGCGTTMKTVMERCDMGSSFDTYASCIKETYTKDGRQPNSASVRAFYASLDSLAELHAANRLSSAEAKAAAYIAFLNTVQADNDRSNAAFANSMNALANMPQGTVQAAPPSIQTRCVRSGNAVNCTSY
ncbi:hypothetical protein [Limnohabitans sp.]|uniref:hypothetical protein n=1 Tax=Limnohabitans sp. TaxID=1907725 RepID=UPI0037BE631B